MKWNKETDLFVLICGHGTSIDGSWDPGCTYGKYSEAALMLKITKEAARYLRGSGIKVLTDADKGNNRNMISCVKWANSKGADFYLSIHCDYKAASSGVYPLYVSSAGKKAAKAIGKTLAKEMKMKYKGVAKRPDLYELTQTNMPAVLLETGAIKADLDKLKDYRKYGKALAKAICGYLDIEFTGKKV